jgi:hypothetical protein
MLPPHPWDDDVHRTAIHTAFDVWFVFHESGDRQSAARWKRRLRVLTTDAKRRALVLSRDPIPTVHGHRRFRIWPERV